MEAVVFSNLISEMTDYHFSGGLHTDQPHTIWNGTLHQDVKTRWRGSVGQIWRLVDTTAAAAAAAKSRLSCPTLCDPIDGSPPGSPVPGILQARTLEWVAISFSNA